MNYFLGVLFFCVVCLFLLNSCKTTLTNPEKYEKTKVYFGNGGGFTGKLNEFCMLDNGDVFAINPASREAILRYSAPKSEAKSIFQSLQDLESKKYPYDKPGNMYYWLKYQSDTDTSYLIWGDEAMKVDKKVSNLYEQLVALTKEQ